MAASQPRIEAEYRQERRKLEAMERELVLMQKLHLIFDVDGVEAGWGRRNQRGSHAPDLSQHDVRFTLSPTPLSQRGLTELEANLQVQSEAAPIDLNVLPFAPEVGQAIRPKPEQVEDQDPYAGAVAEAAQERGNQTAKKPPLAPAPVPMRIAAQSPWGDLRSNQHHLQDVPQQQLQHPA